MIGVNFVITLTIKKATILLDKGKDIEFDVTKYQYLIKKLMHLS